jgi:crotonobetainyl-CoA:carnitine CoA-transferase CaiB-like acyl-CoA transferase
MEILPLNGIRVLDLSRLLPGPYLTQLLVDLGAEVIKVETPGIGDYSRLIPPEMGLHGLFESVNRGKKSLAINYRNKRGREIFLNLVKTADVVLEGFRPGRMDSLGLGYEVMKVIKPNIVYCSLSGFGQSGPYRDRAGHDPTYLALGGALSLNGRPNEKPVPYGLPAADLSGAMLAGIAILAALVGGRNSTQGMYLDMALLDGVISWMTPLALSTLIKGYSLAAGTHPLLGGLATFNNIYETADGKYLILGALEPTLWSEFCKVMERPDWLPRQFDRALSEELVIVFITKTAAEWSNAFSKSDGCVEALNSVTELLAHPQVIARGYIRMEDGKPVNIESPFIFARRELSPPPQLGQHTRQILKELNLSDLEIDSLRSNKVIAFT